MATTPNYGWVTPAPTDFVTDLPADFETFADAVDADLAGLLGGTTGQVLTKDTNADHDFSWTTPTTGIAATIFDAKGDLIAASAADTAARLAVGANGTVLTADSGETTGLRWGVAGGLTEIASASFTTGAVSFTSIPATYKNLVIVGVNLSEANGNNSGVRVRFNNDTGNNYTFAFTSAGATGNASSGASGMKVQADQIIANSSIYVHIDRYKDTNYRPIWFMGSGSNSGWCVRGAGHWNNNAAITRVDVDLISTGTFGAITGTIYLYGVN